MARRKIESQGGEATVMDEEEPTNGEQGVMFPDLDPKKPEEKALIGIAKKWIKIVDERKEYLEDAKEKEDEAHETMVAQAKSLKLERFTIAGREITIEHKDKAKMKTTKVESTDDADQDDD